MDKQAYLKLKNKELKEKGFSNVQSQQIANSLFMQEGGMMVNGFSTNQKPISNIQQVETDGVREGNLPPGYYQRVMYTDGTKDYIQSGEKFKTLQKMPNYINYMKSLGAKNNTNQAVGMLQMGGQATVSPYAMNYPSILNNFAPSPYVQRPEAVTEPDFTGSPFSTTSFTEDPRTTTQQLGSAYQFSDEPTADNPLNYQQVQPQYNDTTRINVPNLYAGVDLDASLAYAGQGFGSGNAWQAGLGTGLSVLKGARNFLTGYAGAKESQRVKKEQFNDIYNPKINYQYAQQGGEITNSQYLTGQYAVDEGIGANYNLESGEFVKRAQTGEVQQVVGEPHTRNGKIADGVNVNLETGDKVLSDYTKIPAKNVRELKERYDLSLKKNATFADAQKAYDKKLGIQKETDELSALIERFGKNSTTEDQTTKRLNDVVLSKEIEAGKKKLDLLNAPQSMVFEDLFSIQESLPKKGGGKLLDDKGKVIEETAQQGVKYQMGGEIDDLAKRFNISPQRAKELILLQEGGQPIPEEQVAQEQQTAEIQQPTPEQVMQFIAQALQQGAQPQEILQQLLDNGIPNEAATQLIQQVIGQSQQQQAPVEGEQMVAQQGVDNTEPGFSFATRYAPTLNGFDVTGRSVVNADQLTGVEPIQSYTGEGYGKQMASVEDLIKLHSDWYFTTEAKKKAFREAAKKEGSQPEVREFQAAYNKEILDRAKKAGVPDTEVNDIINKVGFTEEGARKLDGLAGAFTTTRPLYDFTKSKDGQVKIQETPITTVKTPEVINRNITKQVLPLFPDNLRMAPSAINPIYKEQIALGRLEPNKLTTEPFLASQEAQRQADIARVQATGLSPAQQEALLSQQLASSQMASNDAIAKVETANQANQAQVDQFNLNQRAKEEITNAQLNQQYQSQVLGGINAYERDWNNYYIQANLDNQQRYKDIETINILNSQNSQFAYVPGQGVEFLNNRAPNLTLPSLPTDIYSKMTPEELEAYKRAEIAKSKAQGMKNYTTTIKTVS